LLAAVKFIRKAVNMGIKLRIISVNVQQDAKKHTILFAFAVKITAEL
jgi:hypothetical protein